MVAVSTNLKLVEEFGIDPQVGGVVLNFECIWQSKLLGLGAMEQCKCCQRPAGHTAGPSAAHTPRALLTTCRQPLHTSAITPL
jgi:hypothetical protein